MAGHVKRPAPATLFGQFARLVAALRTENKMPGPEVTVELEFASSKYMYC